MSVIQNTVSIHVLFIQTKLQLSNNVFVPTAPDVALHKTSRPPLHINATRPNVCPGTWKLISPWQPAPSGGVTISTHLPTAFICLRIYVRTYLLTVCLCCVYLYICILIYLFACAFDWSLTTYKENCPFLRHGIFAYFSTLEPVDVNHLKKE
jgi:hypothetical protein